ncbi:MAG TPA: AraC family transcriptional regulator [Desulfobacteraceae bacterium]|nr:AraC family transcriptional regulator [Desulfobacteraceae bacterium]
MNSPKKTLAILIFPDVEVLDFAGPFEVFSVFNELNAHRLLTVVTVSETPGPLRAKNGLKVVPDHTIETAPQPDYLVIPGGVGTRRLLENDNVLTWINRVAGNCRNIMSVCSGSLLLAKLGLLEGLRATTHHEVFEELEGLAPDAEVVRYQRFTDNGKIITSAGVAAGIDMSLYMVGRLYGREQAQTVARYIEYPLA